MTADRSLGRDLPSILEDLYLAPSPDYRDEVVAVAVRTRQRPSWTFPGRWLPMADIAGRPAYLSPVPWRAVGLALLLIALLVAAVAVVGSRRPSVPAPFGLAGNGVIAWALDGDIYTGDPLTGRASAVITSPDIDRNPQFSRDGSHLAFLRQVPNRTGHFDLVSTAADGTAARVLSAVPFSTPESVQWAPDGTSLFVVDAQMRLSRYYVDGRPPSAIAEGVHLEPDAFRPPDGGELLYERDVEPGTIYAMQLDGSGVRPVFNARLAGCECAVGGPARWSPDGSKIAVTLMSDNVQARMHVINADGTGIRQLARTEGTWVENDPAWSPDGTRVAFNRWQRDDAGTWSVQPIAIVAIDTVGATPIGIGPASEGALIDWAPDGTSILMLPGTLVEAYTWSPGAAGTIARPTFIDVVDGSSQQLDWSVGSIASWQRISP
jgi:hypothetical protein